MMKKAPSPLLLKVMLLKDATHRLEWVTQSLLDASCEVVHFSGSLMDMEAAIESEQPDVIMIDTESPSRDTLEHICLYSQVCPQPIVVFTDDHDTEKLRQAVRAGVASYVVSGLSAERVRPILEAAITRHKVQAEMAQELSDAKASLQEQKQINQAKRLLIKQGLSEEQAYQSLRKLAMDSGSTMAEAARKVVRLNHLPDRCPT
jgi:response regulator NasT